MNVLTPRRGLAGFALLGASALVLAGCGPAPDDDGNGPDEVDFLACAVSDEGSWDDKSFN